MANHKDAEAPTRACSDATWEMIPWYVNGSLPADQVAAFEAEANSCPACQAELARLRALSDEVMEKELLEGAQARSWAKIKAQIAEEEAARKPAPQGWFAGLNRGALGLGGAALAACLVLVFQLVAPPDDGFVTLTSSDAGTVMMVQPAQGLERDLLQAVLAELGLSIASGPTEAGLYAIALPEDADVEALADLLVALPEVDFAAPGGP